MEDLVNNPTPRVPVCLCLDVSGSMSGPPIDELNQGVKLLYDAIKDDEVALYSAEVSVVTFGGTDAYIDMAYKELEDRYQNYDNINGVKYKIKQNYDNIVVNLEIEVNDDTKSVNFYLPFSLNDEINSITQKISNCK